MFGRPVSQLPMFNVFFFIGVSRIPTLPQTFGEHHTASFGSSRQKDARLATSGKQTCIFLHFYVVEILYMYTMG
jgi:hypothetical protein